MVYRVGVDVGGSFTDFAVLDTRNGRLSTLKVLSRPDAPGEEIPAALDRFAARDGLGARQVSYFTHGTTVGVNTVISGVERNGVVHTAVSFQ